MATMHPARNALSRASRVPAVLWHDQSGGAMIEYAFVGPAFIALLLGIIYTALVFIAQEGIETATEATGRLVLTGQAQASTYTHGTTTDTGLTAADLKTIVCNGGTITTTNGSVTISKILPPFLTCNNLTIYVAPLANGYTIPGATNYNNGVSQVSYTSSATTPGQNTVMEVQLYYMWPTITGPLGLNLTNQTNGNRLMVGTSVFTTEGYSCATTQTTC